MTDNNTLNALIVDDESDIRELVEITLSRMAIETESVANLADARAALKRTAFQICLTDMRLPDGDGIDLVKDMTKLQPECPIAVITAYASAETAVASLKAGAFDFVSKPIDIGVLRRLVDQALKLNDRKQPAAQEPATNGKQKTAENIIGDAPVLKKLRTKIAKLARSQAPVHITGESGTGKELVARNIHTEGPRFNAAFVPVNCGAIPPELMESEFFGYRKGAFTGATADRDGLVQQAEGGTLFLDEVAELPLNMQVKLLRVIQERAARRVGDTVEEPVDLRIISATKKDLAQEVTQGNFREDLLYRLNVIEVDVPPLRERAGDITAISGHILSRLARQLQLEPAPGLSDKALAALHNYTFPGNIRELENILERAVTLSDAPVIEPDVLRLDSPLTRGTGANDTDVAVARGDGSLEDELDTVERERIRAALEANRYNKTRAARALGITLRALRYRMAKLELE